MPLAIILPTVNGDDGLWGDMLNTALSTIVDAVNANTDADAEKLPLAGGALSGRVDLKTITQAHAHVASSTTPTLDLSTAESFDLTINSATTITFANVPSVANSLLGFILRLENGGSASITWPNSVKWPGGTPPTLTAAGFDLLVFVSDNGGVTWRGVLAASDLR